ncbi:2-phospho-L-lactate guanylyltransferase [Nocardia seriolae]|nr:2-phospho-L-lactate guanylyltransferase [Nocardia seriolae]APB00583.1 2-phospho-L-lactate guanylyltransferase [Nocardia seriolae]MTJ61922.1 2-phospho-L-lactate guanylyltransferase [Nocardia seriolae]MTJ74978.1 2-phospho-L-lactate guanylyltransferase [Nocardia seriolae]MTJ90049.1 2-phospho-L-lactate guanylyltransferase [Nocardia seriolae]MTK34022.1 2-phospho-L-lactate guanylyltransferase [Nocardia seriolae]
MRPSVHAVIAVKSLGLAKSRLSDRLPQEYRPQLVLAMLADTVTAAVSTSVVASVTVVTPDPRVAEVVRGLGAHVQPEPEVTAPHTSGLNAALAAGAAAIRHRHGPVDLLALQADLPALRPAELCDMLAGTGHRRSVIADHEGSGTVALLVRGGSTSLNPLFGPDSARRHIADGAVELLGDWPGLRQDVDTAADLDRAAALGVGAATGALLREIGVSQACRGTEDIRRAGSSLC